MSFQSLRVLFYQNFTYYLKSDYSCQIRHKFLPLVEIVENGAFLITLWNFDDAFFSQ